MWLHTHTPHATKSKYVNLFLRNVTFKRLLSWMSHPRGGDYIISSWLPRRCGANYKVWLEFLGSLDERRAESVLQISFLFNSSLRKLVLRFTTICYRVNRMYDIYCKKKVLSFTRARWKVLSLAYWNTCQDAVGQRPGQELASSPHYILFRKGTPFEAMTGRTAPSSDCLLAEVFWGFP